MSEGQAETKEGKETVEEAKPFGRSLFTDALILAVVSALGYMAAFMYEANYLGYFGFPSHIAEVRAETLLNFVFFSTGAITFLYFSTIFLCNNIKRSYLRFILAPLLLIVVIAMVFAVKFKAPILSANVVSFLTQAFVVLSLINMCFDLYIVRKIQFNIHYKDVHSFVKSTIPIMLIGILWLFYIYGSTSASIQTTFLQVEPSKIIYAIRFYPDKTLSIVVDNDTKTIQNIIVMPFNANLRLTKRTLGHLKRN